MGKSSGSQDSKYRLILNSKQEHGQKGIIPQPQTSEFFRKKFRGKNDIKYIVIFNLSEKIRLKYTVILNLSEKILPNTLERVYYRRINSGQTNIFSIPYPYTYPFSGVFIFSREERRS